jgi:hypothetical protein
MASIFIGIGGTGDWILTYLKEKVRAAYGEVPKDIQFRLLDTLAPDQRNNTAARLGNKVGIGTTEYLQLADHPPGNFFRIAGDLAEQPGAKPYLSRWFKSSLFTKHLAQADFNLVRGAGQHRQFGRMGMFLNKQQVMNMVRRALEDCGARNAGETAIWIVGSVAGGTGAGTFPDMALLARQAAEGLGSHRVLGVAVLPSVFGDVISERTPSYVYDIARADALLREVARFQAPVNPEDRGRDAATREGFRFAVEYDEATRVLQRGQLFDSLVFYDHKCASENDRRSYYSQIADGISLTLDPAVGNKLFASWINAEEGYAASFNSHRVFLPARLYQHLFRDEAILAMVEGLLPLEESGAPKAGALVDRRQDAWDILEKETGPLLSRLARLRERIDIDRLSTDATPRFILENLLGFDNFEATYGADASPLLKAQVAKLYRSLTEEIPKFGDRDNADDFAESKAAVVREVNRRRARYEGDGDDSFVDALRTVRPAVQKRLLRYLDEALAAYLRRHPVSAEGLGRFVIVRNELGLLLNQCRERAQALGSRDRPLYQNRQTGEADARQDMERTSKPMLFGRGDLPRNQQNYFDAVDAAQTQWQRMKLLEFVNEELFAVLQERLDVWQRQATEWQRALDGLRQEARAAIGDIHEELTRHTQTIQSSSLGITNRPDMDGYQEVLRKRCLVDSHTGTPLQERLLNGLEWRWEAEGGLRLQGWLERGDLASGDLYKALREALDAPIAENMRRHEGMAKYLEWLRDVKQGSDLAELNNRLVRATSTFADGKTTSPTRKFLLLHGDQWNPQINQGQDVFLAVFNRLTQENDIGHDRLEHNLRDADGRILFEDRNVIALLVSDNRMDYHNIQVMNDMRANYFRVRAEGEASQPWRTQAYHLFRCEQEAWEIERRRGHSTGLNQLAMLPGEFYRVLDEPERVAAFAQALVAGVVRQKEVDIGREEWICAALDGANPVWLTEGGGDLFRALVTFVQDKKDRRRDYQGELRLDTVKTWVRQAAGERPWAEWVKEFREARRDWLDPGAINGERWAEPRRAFLALALDYYLPD